MIDGLLPFRPPAPADSPEDREVARLLRDGLLVPVLLDIVVAADAPVSSSLRAHALSLVVPPQLRERGGAVTQEAAAWLWCGGAPPRLVDVAVPPGVRSAVPHVVVHQRRMPAEEVRYLEVAGGPPLGVTTRVRTAADLLRTLPEPDALEAAVRVSLEGSGIAWTPSEFAAAVGECLERMPRARGVARARRALASWPGWSDAEDQSMRLPVTR